MINRRILVNLGAFIALFLLLAFWAVTHVVRFDFIDRPYRVTAYFASSPGLRDGFEVAYLGLRVGSIGTVELIDDPQYCTPADEAASNGHDAGQSATGACVAVELKIDRGTELPANVTPYVRRKSAVGEPYVDLVVDPDGGQGQLAAGAHLTDGQIPLAYSDLFRAVNELVQAIPEDAFGVFIHELAVGLDGRGEDLRQLLEGAHDLTGTFASDPAFLDDLSEQLTTLTHTFAEHRDAFGSALDNVAALADTLAANRDALAAFLDTAPQFATQLADLLDASGGDLTCALRSLSAVATDLSDPQRLAELDALLSLAGGAGDTLQGALRQLPDGTWITGGFQFNVGTGTPVPVYPEPHVLPEPPAIRTCELRPAGSASAGAGSGTGAGGSATDGTGATPADRQPRPVTPGAAAGDSTDREANDADPIASGLPLLAILLVLAALAALLKPWRWLAVAPAEPDADDDGGDDAD